MGFLAICSHTDCNGEAAMGFLAICSHTDCNGEAAMGFLAILYQKNQWTVSDQKYVYNHCPPNDRKRPTVRSPASPH